jgi:hypothetical protein
LFDDAALTTKMAAYDRKIQLQGEVKAVQKQIKSASDLCLKDELKCMRRLLRRLGYDNFMILFLS